MENPISAVRSGFTVKNVLGVAVGVFVTALILDALGGTDWLLRPYSKLRALWKPAA